MLLPHSLILLFPQISPKDCLELYHKAEFFSISEHLEELATTYSILALTCILA